MAWDESGAPSSEASLKRGERGEEGGGGGGREMGSLQISSSFSCSLFRRCSGGRWAKSSVTVGCKRSHGDEAR
ncbi:hypothetical protein EYF80_049787 [Liparis tanakae]|uniref:Uncharacterized protein n=1 Tax=Liparis tanakae TaxID=230148 RepID=A0A4Z2FID3_9TELE|nr:hypothetical protein EYF80_049787 [Liparis tanakae]